MKLYTLKRWISYLVSGLPKIIPSFNDSLAGFIQLGMRSDSHEVMYSQERVQSKISKFKSHTQRGPEKTRSFQQMQHRTCLISSQDQPSKCIVLPPHWTCDLMASTDVTSALNPGHRWCSPALLPLETQSFRIFCYYLLLRSIVCGLFFSWVSSIKVELRKTGNKYLCFCPSPLSDSQISEFSKQRKGSNVGQPRSYTKYLVSKRKSRQGFSELPQQKAELAKQIIRGKGRFGVCRSKHGKKLSTK